MRITKAILRDVADWANTYDDDDQGDVYDDYLKHHDVMYETEDYIIIDINLGAFDHGAGNSTVFYYSDQGIVHLYEQTATFIKPSFE